MNKVGIVAAALLMGVNTLAQVFDTDTIVYNGDSDKHINLVILSDGYTDSELSKFVTDAAKFISAFFNEIPYLNYQKYFNVFIIKVPSNESGASHPGTATDVTEPVQPVITVDNYFGSTFDYANIHRLLVATKTVAVSNVLAANFPDYDQALILVNSPYYGGSGGDIPVASTHASSTQIALHELGHSFAGLKDEYWAGDIYASEGINMTKQTDLSLVRWKNWLGFNLIGVYQHCCGGSSSQWYKPHQNCKMQFLEPPYCSVCIQAIIEKIHSIVAPIESYEPVDNNITLTTDSIKLKLNLINPTPNTLKTNWLLNDTFFKQNIDSVFLNESSLLSGTNTLRATVEDTTQLLRVDNHSTIHISSVSWTINDTLFVINTLSVTPSNQDVGSESGNTVFSISSNTNWTISDDAAWLTVSPTSGSGNGMITATYTANALTTPRTGTITISGTGVSPQSVSVIQSEPTMVNTLDELKASIYPNPNKDFILIKFDGTMVADISISVVDELGRSYYLNEYKCANLDKEMIIDLTSLKSGLYFVIIKGENIIKTYKIIKE
jgi:hypothetical protein